MISIFLLIVGGAFLIVFAIPLLLSPSRWSKALQWQEWDRNTPLANYLGRCLGAVAVAFTAMMLLHHDDPAAWPVLLELIAVAGALLLGVHVRGLLVRDQPWTENAEIGLYLAATVIAVVLRVGL